MKRRGDAAKNATIGWLDSFRSAWRSGRRRLRRRSLERPVRVNRPRRLLIQGMLLFAGGAGGLWHLLGQPSSRAERAGAPLRPPTADPDDETFLGACIRCGLCGTVCDSGAIRYLGLDESTHGVGTPYLDVRRRACTLCMACTQVCPTSALRPVAHDTRSILENVAIGSAVVDPDRCLSHLGRVCGYCHDACPYPAVAIRLVPPARPEVIASGCVGCGRCVELCPQVPTAIDVWRRPTG